MKIVFVGAGGHFVPLFCVIQALSKTDIPLIVGRKYALEGDRAISLEYTTAMSLGIPFRAITTGRIQRKFTIRTIPSLLKIPFGLLQAFGIVKEFSPDIVFSGGGYVAFPAAIACVLLRIPFVIHEQVQEAGLVNRLTAPFANKICISWESSRKFFPKAKTILTGNPVRIFSGDINRVREKYGMSKDLPLLYITGGSLGSHVLNNLVEGCLQQLLIDFCVLHQTGDAKEFGDYERLTKKKPQLPKELQKRYALTKFVKPQDVGAVLQNAVLVVSRCGINTISELLLYKKPALLIPLPFSQNNEQYKNALLLKEAGIAEIADQKTLSPQNLYKKLLEMKKNINHYMMKNNEDISHIPDAAKNIIAVLHSVGTNAPPYDTTGKKE